MIGLVDVLTARRRIRPYLSASPLRPSAWLSQRTGADVHLKLESVQLTNSFKIRGAYNAVLHAVEEADGGTHAVRIVTASAGNHGRAVALVCARLGIPATVFTPRTAPETKKAAIRRHGATLRDDLDDYDAAEAAARALAEAEDALFISPYNHPDVIAGAGTVALEILEVLPIFDALVVPLGGGGLASGLGIVLGSAAPHARLLGVEAEASTPFAASMRAGRITAINARPSLADGLTGNLEPGAMTFDIVRSVISEIVCVGEEDIGSAVVGLVAEEQLVTEGAGAVATAALLTRELARAGQTVVVMVTGANIDLRTLTGLAASRETK